MQQQSEAMKRMIAARAALVLDHPFWGTLALKLALQEDPSCDTAWVDGRTLGFNPEYILQLPTLSKVKALQGHEVGHCASGHPWRREGREFGRWNEAADRALNPTLRDEFDLPDDVLFELEPSHLGKSAEWVYNRLPHSSTPDSAGGGGSEDDSTGAGEPPPGVGQPGDSGEPQPGDDASGQPFGGEVRDAPVATEDDDTDVPSEEDWQQAVQQAAVIAMGQGKLPANAKRMVEKLLEPRIDWRSILRRFAQEVARNDYTWALPSARYLAQGLYMPALHSQEVGPFVLAIDVSGSIDNTLLSVFGGAFVEVAQEMQPRRVHVIYCSAAVHGIDTFERGEPVVFNPRGGGGTDFCPVFNALDDLEEQPACLIYLTDLRGTFPKSDNGVPTLWVTPQRYAQTSVPFGEIVAVEE